MKLLYILNVANRVNSFSHTAMLAALELGIEFHIAGNWNYKNDEERLSDEAKYGIKIHQIDFMRNPVNLKNINAYKQLNSLIEKEKYDAIHCNTPIGGVLGRICGKKYNINKIIYQVHGFHFYKGASLINWVLYYPIERILAHLTDAIITINEEDYIRAKTFKTRGGKIYYVNGVGIDYASYNRNSEIRKNKRAELGIDDNEVVLISTGNLDKGKNINRAIKIISNLKCKRIKYFICGEGIEANKLKSLSQKLQLEQQIKFLGFRTDIKELLMAADIFLFTSKREGLSRAMMEAMAMRLPCVVSNIRGNKELIKASDGAGGFLCSLNDEDNTFEKKIELLVNEKTLRDTMGKENTEAIKKFGIEEIKNEMKKIYISVFNLK